VVQAKLTRSVARATSSWLGWWRIRTAGRIAPRPLPTSQWQHPPPHGRLHVLNCSYLFVPVTCSYKFVAIRACSCSSVPARTRLFLFVPVCSCLFIVCWSSVQIKHWDTAGVRMPAFFDAESVYFLVLLINRAGRWNPETSTTAR
jgi:hypothetical protein